MSNDTELLERYATEKSEAAFAELVQRHLDLVYSAAFRLLNGDAHRAQDVCQQVFTELARQAKRVARHPALVGWLYTTTRLMALRVIRSEQRRQAREQEANTMNELLREPAPEPDWNQVRPVLEDAMHDLDEKDRVAILLRFFKNKSLKEVGLELGLSDNAARMRVDRALDKLRLQLARREVTSTATLLATALAGQAVAAAPAGLTTSITSASLQSAAGAGTTFSLFKFMGMTKLKLGIVGAVIVAGVAAPVAILHQAAQPQLRPITLQVKNAPLADVVRELEKQSRAKIPWDRNLTGQVTLEVKNAPLAEALDALAPQVGARWSKVFAVYNSETALRGLESTFRGGGDLETAGWTNLAPQPRKADLPGVPPLGSRISTSGQGVIPASDSPDSARPPGTGGGGFSFVHRGGGTDVTTTITSGGNSNVTMSVRAGPGGVSVTGPGNYQMVRSSRGVITDVWSSERLVLETRLLPQLGEVIPEAATAETADATAAKIKGRFMVYHVLSKTLNGYMSLKHNPAGAGAAPGGSRKAMFMSSANGKTNVITDPDAVAREIQRIQQEGVQGNLQKSPEQQVLDAREKKALKGQ